MKSRVKALLSAAVLFSAGNAGAAGDAARGAALYQSRCTACHSIEYSGFGPAHKDVYGRKAGRVPDFPYSDALKRSTVVWNEKTLDQWLADPESFIPGQRMGVSVTDARDRSDLIAYLKSATGKPAR